VLVEGNSDLFDRYDQALEAKLVRMVCVSRPVLRKLIIIVSLSLFAALVCVSFVEPGFPRIFCTILAGVLVWNCLTRLKLEHSIVQSHGEALGTASKYRRLGTKRGAVLDYNFLSAGNRLQFGTLRGSTELPQEGQTFLVVYNLADPSLSLPLFSFWFLQVRF
jgi:hypothetical protein